MHEIERQVERQARATTRRQCDYQSDCLAAEGRPKAKLAKFQLVEVKLLAGRIHRRICIAVGGRAFRSLRQQQLQCLP